MKMEEYALGLGVVNTVLVVLLAIAQWRGNRKTEKAKAHEQVYEDVSFVLTYPYRQRGKEANARQYTNGNPELQEAVRAYLDSHWMTRMWPGAKFTPPGLSSEEEKRAFRKKVTEEASAFERERFQYHIGVDFARKSPVFYLDDDQISSRLDGILTYVGQHLSLFSRAAQGHWENAKSRNYERTKTEYEQALQVCPHFFEHNGREFDDPFLDLLTTIRQDYRDLIKPWISPTDWAIVRKVRSAKLNLHHRLSTARHPLISYKVWRTLPGFVWVEVE